MTTTLCNFYDFTKSCRMGMNVLDLYERVNQVYDYLCAHKGEEFSPTDIAKGINAVRVENGEKGFFKLTKDAVRNPLRILKKMGLVGNTSYKKTVHLDLCSYYVTKKVEIDGVTYFAKVLESGERDKEVTMYRWFAL